MADFEAQIWIPKIRDNRNGTFTAEVSVYAPDIGEIEFDMEVEAADYGDAPRQVFKILEQLGNAIAKNAFIKNGAVA